MFDSDFLDDCADMIVKGYGLSDVQSIKFLLKEFPNRWVRVNDTIVLYLCLSDIMFDKLKKGLLDLSKVSVLVPLLKDEGVHTHVFGVVSASVKDMKFVADIIRQKSISWYTPDMSRLVIFER